MIQDTIVYTVILLAFSRTVYSIVLFFKRSRNKEIIVCSGCSQCGKKTSHKSF